MRETKDKDNERGITLVALVVTIIVLMILAGITLTLVLGQNGIISKAQQSKDLSINADKATAEGFNNLDNEMIAAIGAQTVKTMSTTVSASIGKKLSDTDNIVIKDDEGNIVTIPAGFKIASDSAVKQEDGIVIEDKDGNQFVWIPVANISNYTRTDFGASYDWGGDPSSYSETIPSDEQTSVNLYHGYYLGRYEAGDSVSTASKASRVNGTSVTNKVSIKQSQAPYNWVTRDQANTLATGMKAAENYIGITKLCSSYAWDTAINFIQNKVANYTTNSPQGNYWDTTFNFTDITGATKTKALNSAVLIPTGETTPLCSIYDMAGNAWDWTTEACNVTNYPCVGRGGACNANYALNAAGYRTGLRTNSDSNIGFRVTFYM